MVRVAGKVVVREMIVGAVRGQQPVLAEFVEKFGAAGVDLLDVLRVELRIASFGLVGPTQDRVVLAGHVHDTQPPAMPSFSRAAGARPWTRMAVSHACKEKEN